MSRPLTVTICSQQGKTGQTRWAESSLRPIDVRLVLQFAETGDGGTVRRSNQLVLAGIAAVSSHGGLQVVAAVVELASRRCQP